MVLPLQSYDMILGMDWLEHFSPMKVHWRHKWMVIPYQGSTVVLQGILLEFAKELLLQITSVQLQPSPAPTDALPDGIAKLLVQFEVVFSNPTSLPPVRECDHSIPLIPGA